MDYGRLSSNDRVRCPISALSSRSSSIYPAPHQQHSDAHYRSFIGRWSELMHVSIKVAYYMCFSHKHAIKYSMPIGPLHRRYCFLLVRADNQQRSQSRMWDEKTCFVSRVRLSSSSSHSVGHVSWRVYKANLLLLLRSIVHEVHHSTTSLNTSTKIKCNV
jgi:hypothetical protein